MSDARDHGDRSGRLEEIWIKRARRGVMDPVETATLEAGAGIRGNANRGGHRQVTVISRERWHRVMNHLDADVDPKARRANFMVSGVELEETRGRVLKLGRVRLRILGETKPCERMDEAHPGLREALRPHWGGGVYGEVMDSGTVSVGDPVDWV